MKVSNLLILTVFFVLTTNSIAKDDVTNSGLEITKPSTNEIRPGQNNLIVYIDQITNLTLKPVTIVGATSPIAEKIELHTMKIEDNIMKMEKVESLTISGKGSISLKKGNKNGYHLMLFNIKKESLGKNFPMSIYLDNGKGKDFQVQILKHSSPNHQNH